jgi:hypothetical protein
LSTVTQRVGAVLFSKNLNKHIAAIWNFIHH